MSNSGHQNDPRIDAYLDGTMSEEARAEFQRELDANLELRAEVELRRQCAAAIERRFQPPAMPEELIARLRQARTDEPVVVPLRKSNRLGLYAAAASLLVWGGLAWYYVAPMFERDVPPPPPDLAQQYKQFVDSGFQPMWVCKDGHEFASTFLQRQGQGVLLAPMPEGTKMVGLTYYGGLSSDTTTMLARVDGEPVVIYVDRATANPQHAPLDPQSHLHLFRKELGPLVVFELSPLDAPRVMEYLYPSDVPPEGSPLEVPPPASPPRPS